MDEQYSHRSLSSLEWSGSTRVLADGGANRLYSLFTADADRLKHLPDYICGDLDSIEPRVREWYVKSGVPIYGEEDQDTTDMQKCIMRLLGKSAVREVVVLGGMGGRFDHEISSVHTLHRFQSADKRVMLVSPDGCTLLLPCGKHVLVCDAPEKTVSCGLFPMVGPARVSTSGLKWDLDGLHPISMQSFISTSNTFGSSAGGASCKVHIETDNPVIWTMSYEL